MKVTIPDKFAWVHIVKGHNFSISYENNRVWVGDGEVKHPVDDIFLIGSVRDKCAHIRKELYSWRRYLYRQERKKVTARANASARAQMFRLLQAYKTQDHEAIEKQLHYSQRLHDIDMEYLKQINKFDDDLIKYGRRKGWVQ